MPTWTAQLRFTGLTTTLTDAQADHLADHLDTYTHNADTGRLTATMTVTTPYAWDVVQNTAYTTTMALLAEACLTSATLVGLTIETEEEQDHQLRTPDPITLIDTTTAGQILNRTRQRAGQLLDPKSAKRDPNAPTPLATTRNGPLWTREAIELYALERDPSQDPWKNRR